MENICETSLLTKFDFLSSQINMKKIIFGNRFGDYPAEISISLEEHLIKDSDLSPLSEFIKKIGLCLNDCYKAKTCIRVEQSNAEIMIELKYLAHANHPFEALVPLIRAFEREMNSKVAFNIRTKNLNMVEDEIVINLSQSIDDFKSVAAVWRVR